MIIGITDRNLYENEQIYLKKIDLFLRSDLDYLIVREKDLDIHDYGKLIEKILLNNHLYKSKIIVHTHVDIAKAYGLDKVHLPENRMEATLFSEIKYSFSVHPKHLNMNELDKLVEKAFFIMVSPVFKTTCKPECKPLDQTLLFDLKQKYNQQLVLLGGLNRNRIMELRVKGFLHFAVRSGIEELLL